MKRKLLELLTVAIIGATVTETPVEAPAEPEHIELAWNFGEVDEEPELTKYDINLIARLVMSEAGYEPYMGKVAVAMTVLNRCDYYGESTETIVYAPNQYYVGNLTPTEECFSAVAFAIEHREVFPSDMMYFRTSHYHGFGCPYTIIGNHYFSTATPQVVSPAGMGVE